MSAAEAAQLWGVATATVYRMARDGRFSALRDELTLRLRVPVAEVARVAEELGRLPRRARKARGNMGGRPRGATQKTWPTPAQVKAMRCSPIRKAMLLRHHTLGKAAAELGLSMTTLAPMLRCEVPLRDDVAMAAERVYRVPFGESKRYHYEVYTRQHQRDQEDGA